MNIDLVLYTGKDIVFESNFKIHQPTIAELSERLPDEKDFFKLVQVLTIKNSESPRENFQTFLMLLLGWQNILDENSRIGILKLLELLFKDYSLKLDKEELNIQIWKNNDFIVLNGENFVKFQDIIKGIFAYDTIFKGGKEGDYNPGNDKAREIAEKLKKRHQKIAEQKGNQDKSFFGNYLSVVSIGLGIDMTTLSEKLTVFQLIKELERIGMKQNFEQLLRIKTSFVTAGSSKEPLEDWMRFI